MNRRYPPFAQQTKFSKWNPNHLFILAGSKSWECTKALNESGHCGAVVCYPEQHAPNSFRWPVSGLDVTVKSTDTSEDTLEELSYELLRAGANLVVVIHGTSADIAVYRQKEIADAA